MATLSVTEASRRVGVSRQIIYEKIKRGEIKRSSTGIDVAELKRAYPHLTDLKMEISDASLVDKMATANETVNPSGLSDFTGRDAVKQASTVELLIRELEWNKELLEQTNQLMARQLAEQRALIADQARRLDEKDRFWARQIEIAQSLLPAPAPRKKFLGLF